MEFTEVKYKTKVKTQKLSFKELCDKQCKNFQEDRSNILYELDNYDSIYNSLLKMNSLGYYTVVSQPAEKNVLFSTCF